MTTTPLPSVRATRGTATVHAGTRLHEGGMWITKCGQNQMRTLQRKVTYALVDEALTCPKCIAQQVDA